MAEIISAEKAAIVAEGKNPDTIDFNFNAGDTRRSVLAVYLGETRPIAANVKELIQRWADSVLHNSTVVSVFRREIRVREGTSSYWLPIQDVLYSDVTNECAAGDVLELFVTWIGSTKADWVFLINAFRKTNAPPEKVAA